MAADRIDEQLAKWLDAETDYRRALKEFVKLDRSRAASRSAALALEKVRAKADKHRDKYFKAALRPRT